MSKRVIVYEETVKFKHEFVIDVNISDSKIETILDTVASKRPEHIDDISVIFKEMLGNKLISFNQDDSGEVDEIEYFDDYVEEDDD